MKRLSALAIILATISSPALSAEAATKGKQTDAENQKAYVFNVEVLQNSTIQNEFSAQTFLKTPLPFGSTRQHTCNITGHEPVSISDGVSLQITPQSVSGKNVFAEIVLNSQSLDQIDCTVYGSSIKTFALLTIGKTKEFRNPNGAVLRVTVK